MIEEGDEVIVTDEDSKWYNRRGFLEKINHWSKDNFYSVKLYWLGSNLKYSTYEFKQNQIKKYK